jgi:diguanylate cyclase (GGDEF)-like protein/PAS domain S-box-containing protein
MTDDSAVLAHSVLAHLSGAVGDAQHLVRALSGALVPDVADAVGLAARVEGPWRWFCDPAPGIELPGDEGALCRLWPLVDERGFHRPSPNRHAGDAGPGDSVVIPLSCQAGEAVVLLWRRMGDVADADLHRASKALETLQLVILTALVRDRPDLGPVVSDAVVAVDRDFRVIRWNKGAERLYGIPPQIAVGEALGDLYSTFYDDPATDTDLAWTQLQDSGHWQGQVTQRSRVGLTRSVFASVTLLRDREGEVSGAIAVNQDASEVLAARAGLGPAQALTVRLLDSNPDLAVILDRDGVIVAANRAWLDAALVGRARMDRTSVGARYLSVLESCEGDEDTMAAARSLRLVLQGKASRATGRYRCDRPDGHHWFDWEAFPATGEGGAVVIHHDVSVLTGAGELPAPIQDPLTGLPDRSALPLLVDRATREGDPRQKLTLISMDIDRFATINEAVGYRAGDAVLQEVARRLRDCFPPRYKVMRFSGDQFAAFVAAEGASAVEAILEPVQRTLRQPIRTDRGEVSVSFSIGIADVVPTGMDPVEVADVLASHSDAARSQSRDAGRNRVQHYTNELGARTRSLVTSTHDFMRDLGRNIPELYFQQIRRVDDDRVCAFEALLRWPQPDGAVWTPASFLEVLGTPTVVGPLAEWTVERAAASAAALQLHYPDTIVAMNMSARQLVEIDVASLLLAQCDRLGLSPTCLSVEVTETDVFDDHRVVPSLQSLRAAGVAIALDDFGTGFSSLTHLQELSPQIVKIDRSFIMDMGQSDKSEAVVAALISLAHRLDLVVIAEGVEEPDQLSSLRRYGCDQYQGYLADRPSSLHDCIAKSSPQS